MLGSTVALTAAGIYLIARDHLGSVDPVGSNADPNLRWYHPLALEMLDYAQNIWFYGVFAAYRDARLMRGDIGYRHPVARETLGQLASAPFRPRIWKRPWFWAGLPLMLGAAVG